MEWRCSSGEGPVVVEEEPLGMRVEEDLVEARGGGELAVEHGDGHWTTDVVPLLLVATGAAVGREGVVRVRLAHASTGLLGPLSQLVVQVVHQMRRSRKVLVGKVKALHRRVVGQLIAPSVLQPVRRGIHSPLVNRHQPTIHVPRCQSQNAYQSSKPAFEAILGIFRYVFKNQ